jgi:CRP-like cAMP-binding protein
LWAEQTGEDAPPPPPFDAAAALSRIALFRALSAADLDGVVDRLRAITAAPGEVFAEGGDRLLMIRSGRGEVMTASMSGERIVTRSVGPGEVFGLSALQGSPTGTVLRAADAMELLELDGDAIAGLTRRHATIARARSGRGTMVAPSGGRRLTVMGTRIADTGSTSFAISAAEVRAQADAARARTTVTGAGRG